MLNLFKKKISTKELASGLYRSSIVMHINKRLNDEQGNLILTKQEQALLLTYHLSELLEIYNLNKAQPYLLASYATDIFKPKNDDELHFQMAVAIDSLDKIKKYFSEIFPHENKFFSENFLFEKELTPVQKTLAISWYRISCETIDVAFQSAMNKIVLLDDEDS